MLDDSSKADKEITDLKNKLSILMNSGEDIYIEFKEIFGIEPS